MPREAELLRQFLRPRDQLVARLDAVDVAALGAILEEQVVQDET